MLSTRCRSEEKDSERWDIDRICKKEVWVGRRLGIDGKEEINKIADMLIF